MSVIIATCNHPYLRTVSRKVGLEVIEDVTMTPTSLDTLHPETILKNVSYLPGSGSWGHSKGDCLCYHSNQGLALPVLPPRGGSGSVTIATTPQPSIFSSK